MEKNASSLCADLALSYPLVTALSHDGSWVVWLESYADVEADGYLVRLHLQRSDGGEAALYPEEGWNEMSTPAWSRNDKLLCWYGRKNGKLRAIVINPFTGVTSEVLQDCQSIGGLGWIGDTELVLLCTCVKPYNSDGSGPANYTRLDILDADDGKVVRSLELPDIFHASSLSIDTSGREVVFTGVPCTDRRDQRRWLYCVDIGTSSISVLKDGQSAIFSPVWHSYRRQLLWLTREGAWNDLDGAKMWMFDMATRTEELLLDNLEYATQLIRWDDQGVWLQGQTNAQRLGLHYFDAEARKLREQEITNLQVAYGFSCGEGRMACIGLSRDRGPEVLASDVENRSVGSTVQMVSRSSYSCCLKSK
ncbi:MAG: hypothetical protein ACAI35_07525 [Candidatus Methylacidiphilales bacterium]